MSARPMHTWTSLSEAVVGALLYVGIFASVIAFLACNKAIALIGPARTAVIYYAIPSFSGIAGWAVLDEPVTLVHGVSMVLIVAGIAVANRRTAGNAQDGRAAAGDRSRVSQTP